MTRNYCWIRQLIYVRLKLIENKNKSRQTRFVFCVFHYLANGLTETVYSGIFLFHMWAQMWMEQGVAWVCGTDCAGLDGTVFGSANVGATGVDGMYWSPADHRLRLQRLSVGSCWSVAGSDIIWLLPWAIHSLHQLLYLPVIPLHLTVHMRHIIR